MCVCLLVCLFVGLVVVFVCFVVAVVVVVVVVDVAVVFGGCLVASVQGQGSEEENTAEAPICADVRTYVRIVCLPVLVLVVFFVFACFCVPFLLYAVWCG